MYCSFINTSKLPPFSQLLPLPLFLIHIHIITIATCSCSSPSNSLYCSASLLQFKKKPNKHRLEQFSSFSLLPIGLDYWVLFLLVDDLLEQPLSKILSFSCRYFVKMGDIGRLAIFEWKCENIYSSFLDWCLIPLWKLIFDGNMHVTPDDRFL